MPHQTNPHIDIALAFYGPLPHPCYWCANTVDTLSVRKMPGGVVHHLDHDHYNNQVENLVFAHATCHASHHNSGKVMSESAKAKIREYALKWNADPVNKQRKSESMREAWASGRKKVVEHIWTEEERKKQGERISASARKANPSIAIREAERLAYLALPEEERRALARNKRSTSMKQRIAEVPLLVHCPYGCGKECRPGPMKRHTNARTCLKT